MSAEATFNGHSAGECGYQTPPSEEFEDPVLGMMRTLFPTDVVWLALVRSLRWGIEDLVPQVHMIKITEVFYICSNFYISRRGGSCCCWYGVQFVQKGQVTVSSSPPTTDGGGLFSSRQSETTLTGVRVDDAWKAATTTHRLGSHIQMRR